MRLNKFIAHYSKYSRREADRLIEEGEVTINKKVTTDFSYQVKESDYVYVKKQAIKRQNDLTVIVFNKPKGVLVTKKDDRERTTIYHLLPGKFRHFIPVGRLDYASEGLLILTNNTAAATALMEAPLPRSYNIKIDKPLCDAMIEAMQKGLVLDDATKGAHPLSKTKSMSFKPFEEFSVRSETKNYTKLRVTITEGKNRELRRFFGHFDANVLDLKRVQYGSITLDNLPTKKTRYFSKKEYEELRSFLKKQNEVRK